MTYLRAEAPAQCAGALAKIISVTWGDLQGAQQAVQVIKTSISGQLFQTWQGAAEVN